MRWASRGTPLKHGSSQLPDLSDCLKPSQLPRQKVFFFRRKWRIWEYLPYSSGGWTSNSASSSDTWTSSNESRRKRNKVYIVISDMNIHHVFFWQLIFLHQKRWQSWQSILDPQLLNLLWAHRMDLWMVANLEAKMVNVLLSDKLTNQKKPL